MFRSATFKLTMWYLALVMAISLIFSGVLYNVASGELSRGLHHESARIGSQFPVFQGDPILRPNADITSGDHRLVLRLIGFNLIVVVGAGFASYWLARRTLEPIEEAHEQQKRFTADVSHELRTPLTALKMESEVALMNDKADKAELRATITSNLEEAAKLETLINNLLRLTKLEAEELRQNFLPISAIQLIEQSVAQLQRIASSRHIIFHKHLTDSITFGDQDSLQQLLVILLDNAIKYSPNGSRIDVTTKPQGNNTEFIIQDYGSGIKPIALEHIFDRFYRADSSRTKADTEGFGLGLSIAKMIADIHAATITVSSQPGQGTTVMLTLPTATTK